MGASNGTMSDNTPNAEELRELVRSLRSAKGDVHYTIGDEEASEETREELLGGPGRIDRVIRDLNNVADEYQNNEP